MKSEREVTQEAKKAIRTCLSEPPFVELRKIREGIERRGAAPDLFVELAGPDGDRTMVVECKSSGQPRVAREAIGQIKDYLVKYPRAYGVFVAPHISTGTAAMCTAENIGYVDLAGNCRLSFGSVFVQRTGEPNPFPRNRQLKSLYSPTSVKTRNLLRVLLGNPKRIWRTQELAVEAGASLGQVANVKKILEDQEWVKSDSRGFSLTEPVALLQEWSENYRIEENRLSDFYSLDSPTEAERKLSAFCQERGVNYALTGFSAAARLAPAVRYNRVTAYIETEEDMDRVVQGLNVKRVPSGANVVLLVPQDPSVFYIRQEVAGAVLVSAEQIFLDLRGLHERGEEAAEALLRGVIEPRWR